MMIKKSVSIPRQKKNTQKISSSSPVWLDLRAEGLSISEAAAKLKITDAPKESVEHLRLIELMRLEKMFSGIAEAAFSGEGSAIDRALAILARRAKLLGFETARSPDEEGAQARDTLVAKIEALAARTE